MDNKKSAIVIVLLLALYWLILLMGPKITASLFERGQTAILNSWTGNTAVEPVEFYLGRTMETLWGPVAQALGGLVLIVLVLGPLRQAGGWIFFGVLCAFLLVTKANILLMPPYGDAVGGPFAEGLWLARNNFDYAALARQPDYSQGGPRVYFFSIFPSYLALLMKMFGAGSWFLLVNHLVFFGMAAGVATMIRGLLSRCMDSRVAGLAAALVLSWPVFQTQTEIVNMELPSLFFAVLCAWALARHNIHLAGTGALLSLLAKGSGVFACGAFFVYGLVAFVSERDARARRQWLIWAGALAAAGFFIVAAKFFMKDQHVSAGLLTPLIGWPSLKTFKITYFYLAQILLTAVLAFFFVRRRGLPFGPGIRDRQSMDTGWLMALFAGMWFLLFLNFMNVSPRYRVAVYPFLLGGLVWIMACLLPWRRLQILTLSAAVILVQFNAYGLRDRVMTGSDYVLLEENLQYRNDLEVYRRLARRIEEHYAQAAVAAPMVVAQTLAIPQMGYVRKPRSVYIYGFNCTYENIVLFPGLENIDPSRTVYVTTSREDEGVLPYPVHPSDKVIDTVVWGNKKAWIFMGGISIEIRRRLMLQMLQQRALRNAAGQNPESMQ